MATVFNLLVLMTILAAHPGEFPRDALCTSAVLSLFQASIYLTRVVQTKHTFLYFLLPGVYKI